MKDPSEGDTVEYELPPPAEFRDPPPAYSSLVQVDMCGSSHQGKVRPNNEDHFLTLRFGRFLQPLQTNLPADQRPTLSEETGQIIAIGKPVTTDPSSDGAISPFSGSQPAPPANGIPTS